MGHSWTLFAAKVDVRRAAAISGHPIDIVVALLSAPLCCLGEWGHSLILLIVGGDKAPLEPHGRAYHRPVDDVVEFEFGCAGTLRIVHVQRSKAHVAIDRDAVDLTERRVVGGDCLP